MMFLDALYIIILPHSTLTVLSHSHWRYQKNMEAHNRMKLFLSNLSHDRRSKILLRTNPSFLYFLPFFGHLHVYQTFTFSSQPPWNRSILMLTIWLTYFHGLCFCMFLNTHAENLVFLCLRLLINNWTISRR